MGHFGACKWGIEASGEVVFKTKRFWHSVGRFWFFPYRP